MSLFVHTFSLRVMVVTIDVSLAKNKKLKLISLSINAQMCEKGSECDTWRTTLSHLPQEGPELDSHGSLNIYQHYSPVWLWAYLMRKFFGLEFNLLSSFTLIKKKKAPKSIVQKNIEMEQEEAINDEMKRFPKGPKLYKPIFAAKMIQ